MAWFRTIFKKEKLLDIDKEVEKPRIKTDNQQLNKMLKPQMEKYKKSVRSMDKENTKILITLEEALAVIAGGKKGFKLKLE